MRFPYERPGGINDMERLNPPVLHEVNGVIHCHSTYSDGMETIPVIAQAANRTGLDFLLMTDHDTLRPLEEVGEQWFGSTLLLLGCEITPRNNHYLAYGIRNPISPHLPPSQYIAAVADQGGIGFMAHPNESGSRFLGQNSYSWLDWTVSEFTGMEIWNYFSEWVGCCQSLTSTLRTALSWRRTIRGPVPATLARWDELGRTRRVTGIGGLDAHGIKGRILGVDMRLHPYEKAFRTVRTHLLMAAPFAGELQTDRALVVDALREGSCYFANHDHGNPAGFTFVGRQGGRWLTMGQETRIAEPGGVYFSARAPWSARSKPLLRLLKDGEAVRETVDCDLQAWDLGPGVYRVEAWKNGWGWIYSNPIYLRG